MPVLCGRCSQTAELLSRLRRSTGGVLILRRGHHVPTIYIRIRRIALLAVMLWMVLLPTIPRTTRVVLRRGRHLLVLVLWTRGRAAEGYLRGRLLVMLLLVLRGRRDGERCGGRGVGGLGRARARVALGSGATAAALLASARGGFFFCVVIIFFGWGPSAPNGYSTRHVVRRARH